MIQNVTAILSMLHEPPHNTSATRHFRQAPVLHWTLQRLAMSKRIKSFAVLCWDDQLEAVAPLAEDGDAHILSKNPRVPIATVEAVTASRRWADGWRGGLLAACDFDLGFYGPWAHEIVQRLGSDAVVLIDPSAGLVDPQILDELVARAEEQEALDIVFTQAPPGLAGVLLRPSLIEKLAGTALHPGKLLAYLPDQPARDPIGGLACVPIPTPVARSTRSFRLDSDRQIARMTQAAVSLNGQLIRSNAEELLHRLDWIADVDAMPREIVLELNTNRATSPIYWPGGHLRIERPPMSLDAADRIFQQFAKVDDVRLTLAGVGDPLLNPQFEQILERASAAGIRAIHVETDLLPGRAEVIDVLVDRAVDVVSIHIPAMSPETYAAIMGIDALGRVLENLKRLVQRRHARSSGVPIIVPTFTKCQRNLGEMEGWYDQWIRAVGSAVIVGPSDYGGVVPECGVGDMAPTQRSACRRIHTRMTILSDGTVASCEQDVSARSSFGNAVTQDIADIWMNQLNPLRRAHACGKWSASAICAGCREWHRP